MRTFLLSLIIGAILCLFVGLVAFSPYHFTSVAINDGISMPFLKLDKLPRTYIFNEEYEWMTPVTESAGNSLWEEINFGDAQIEVPLKHPLFLLSPLITIKEGREFFGLKYIDHQGRELMSFIPDISLEWETERGGDSIFSLPIFVAHLQSLGRTKIWRDIFTRQVVDPLAAVHSLSSLGELGQFSYEQMLYDIYLLSLRKKYFPLGTHAFRVDEYNVAWIERSQSESEGLGRLFREEWILIPHLGKVHRFVLRTRKDSAPAALLRSHLVRSFRFVPSDPDQTRILHARFQKLNIREKSDQEGLSLLYSAWTHSPDQKEFLREMIQYSERGSKNEALITPLYNYAFKKYGTNFSNISGKLLETPGERLKRRIKEDEAKELEALRRSKDYIPEEFGSDEERLEFFLNRAKEEGGERERGILQVP